MSTAGFLFLAAFTVIVVALVAYPFLTARSSAPTKVQIKLKEGVLMDRADDLDVLTAEREAVLIALRDLDFDYQTGKLTQTDHYTQREMLLQRGAALLRQLDQRRDDQVEAAVQQLRVNAGRRAVNVPQRSGGDS